MALRIRLQNLARLVRGGDARYAARYYWDRLRTRTVSAARAGWLDLRYARRPLGGDAPSRFGHLGARAVHHTAYEILDLILDVAPPGREDILVDVGCGKGRVLIHWLRNACGRRLVGLELDPDIAAATGRRLQRFSRVQVVAGDAIEHLPQDGTYFYLYNPFTEDKAIAFEARLQRFPHGHPIRVVYYNPNFLEAFPEGRWSRTVVPLDGRLDVGTLKRFCFPVAVLDRRHESDGGQPD